MPELNIASAEVFPSANAVIVDGVQAAGEITAGKFIFLNGSGKWEIPSGTGGRQLTDTRGIALSHAYTNQPLSVVIEDPGLILGATANMTNSESYALASANGQLIAFSELPSGALPVIAGIAISNTAINFKPYASGVAKP